MEKSFFRFFALEVYIDKKSNDKMQGLRVTGGRTDSIGMDLHSSYRNEFLGMSEFLVATK